MRAGHNSCGLLRAHTALGETMSGEGIEFCSIMEGNVIRRILNRRTLAAYFGVSLLLTVITKGAGSAADILGGFVPVQGGRLNVLEIMRWNLGVLAPVVASILFMDEELGTLRYFTLPRSKSVGSWCRLRFIAVGVANLVYLLVAQAVSAIYAMVRIGWGRSHVNVVGDIANATGSAVGVMENAVRSADTGKVCFFCIFLIVFLVHSFTMSVVSAALLACKGKPQAPVLLFLVVEGFLATIGSLFPHVSTYLPPYWGMVQQACSWAEGGIFYLLGTVGTQLVLAVCAVRYVAVILHNAE